MAIGRRQHRLRVVYRLPVYRRVIPGVGPLTSYGLDLWRWPMLFAYGVSLLRSARASTGVSQRSSRGLREPSRGRRPLGCRTCTACPASCRAQAGPPLPLLILAPSRSPACSLPPA